MWIERRDLQLGRVGVAHLFQPLRGVRHAIVYRSNGGQPFPRFVRAPGGEQRVRVAVPKPEGPGLDDRTVELPHLEGVERLVDLAEIAVCTATHEQQLRPCCRRKFIKWRLVEQRQSLRRATQGPLAVGHDGYLVS